MKIKITEFLYEFRLCYSNQFDRSDKRWKWELEKQSKQKQ